MSRLRLLFRTDPSLPRAKLRSAIFWVLFATWPLERLVEHVWHPYWLPDVADVCAALTALAFLLGKIEFQDTQATMTARVAEVMRAIELLGEPPPGPPDLVVIPGGARARPRRRHRRGA